MSSIQIYLAILHCSYGLLSSYSYTVIAITLLDISASSEFFPLSKLSNVMFLEFVLISFVLSCSTSYTSTLLRTVATADAECAFMHVSVGSLTLFSQKLHYHSFLDKAYRREKAQGPEAA